MPEILLNFWNDKIGMEIYQKEKDTNAIDIEAENIYLVKAIHGIEDEGTFVEISKGTEKILVTKENDNNIEKELRKLVEYNILKKVNIEDNRKKRLEL